MTGDACQPFLSSCLSNKPAAENKKAASTASQAVSQFLHR